MISHPHPKRRSCITLSQRSGALVERKEMHMRTSLLTPEMIAAYGKSPTKLASGANSGFRKRDWDKLVRGEEDPVVEEISKTVPHGMRFRAGHGAVR